jgi:hypothetical protein
MTDDEMASTLRAKGWQVSPPTLTPQTCKHLYIWGSITVGTGRTYSSAYCPDCGYTYEHVSPPTQLPASFMLWQS